MKENLVFSSINAFYSYILASSGLADDDTVIVRIVFWGLKEYLRRVYFLLRFDSFRDFYLRGDVGDPLRSFLPSWRNSSYNSYHCNPFFFSLWAMLLIKLLFMIISCWFFITFFTFAFKTGLGGLIYKSGIVYSYDLEI